MGVLGQLDGGHVVYALFGRAHQRIARFFIAVIFAMGFLGWQGWWLWVILSTLLGVGHPPIPDPTSPLGSTRIWLGRATVLLFILIFTPFPIVTR